MVVVTLTSDTVWVTVTACGYVGGGVTVIVIVLVKSRARGTPHRPVPQRARKARVTLEC